jgi:hypothetical protein
MLEKKISKRVKIQNSQGIKYKQIIEQHLVNPKNYVTVFVLINLFNLKIARFMSASI